MSEYFKFDLTNTTVFPVLYGLKKHLDTYESPLLDLFSELNIKFSNEEEEIENFGEILTEIKFKIYSLYTHFYGFEYMEKLKKERDNYLAPNLPTVDQRNFSIQTYNSIVIKEIKIWESNINRLIFITFPAIAYYGDLDYLPLKYFDIWYEKFPTEDENKIMTHLPNSQDLSFKKLKWLGNASHLGYIFYQLAEKGFIEFPIHRGEVNYTGLAERLLNTFDLNDPQPTKKYLSEQINPDSENNKLSSISKAKITMNIADLRDLK